MRLIFPRTLPRLGALLLWVVLGILPALLQAQTSPYVPNLDPAYQDLDALVIDGLVRDIIMGERPYSRVTFARFALEARRRVDTVGQAGIKPRFLEALQRIERRFARELAGLADVTTTDPEVDPIVWIREASVDATVADSPSREMPTLYNLATEYIDADLNPLLQNNQGRVLGDSWAFGAEALLELQLGSRVAVQARPRVWADSGREGQDARADATLLEAYGRTLVGPVSLELGRNHVSLGHGPAGGPILSHNARGLDMIRLSFERPLRLPGPLGVLGLWHFSSLFADMGTNRDIPHSKLIVNRLTWRPSAHVEFGATTLSHQGGEGGPDVDMFSQRIKDAYGFFLSSRANISDRVLGADVRITIPSIRSEVYLNGLTTDDRGRFKQPAGGLWEDAVWVAGFRTSGLGAQGRLGLWGEARHAGATPHVHSQFTSGLTLDRRVIGDFMGPLATGVQGGVEWRGQRDRVLGVAAWERYSSDLWWLARNEFDEPGSSDWTRLTDNPDEIRLRTIVEWTRFPAVSGFQTTLGVGYEHVKRFNFTGPNRSNVLVQLEAGYVW